MDCTEDRPEWLEFIAQTATQATPTTMLLETAPSARPTARHANAKEIHAGVFIAPSVPLATPYRQAGVCRIR